MKFPGPTRQNRGSIHRVEHGRFSPSFGHGHDSRAGPSRQARRLGFRCAVLRVVPSSNRAGTWAIAFGPFALVAPTLLDREARGQCGAG